jgi:hypothetical protein
MKIEGRKWLATKPQHLTATNYGQEDLPLPYPKALSRETTSTAESACILDKALSAIRHQGFLKNGQKATKPDKDLPSP